MIVNTPTTMERKAKPPMAKMMPKTSIFWSSDCSFALITANTVAAANRRPVIKTNNDLPLIMPLRRSFTPTTKQKIASKVINKLSRLNNCLRTSKKPSAEVTFKKAYLPHKKAAPRPSKPRRINKSLVIIFTNQLSILYD